MNWFWALWGRARGLEQVPSRLEDFVEVVVFSGNKGCQAYGYLDPNDGEGLWGDIQPSMHAALADLLLKRHEAMKRG